MLPNYDAVVAIAKAIEAGRDVADSSGDIAKQIMLDLDAAGFVIRKKPATRKPAPSRVPVAFDTGDPALDAFMRKNHTPGWKPKAIPMSMRRGLPALKKMTLADQNYAETQWRAEVARAAEQVADGKPSEAETALRNMINLHRPEWVRDGRSGYRSVRDHGYTIKHAAGGRFHLIDPDGVDVSTPHYGTGGYIGFTEAAKKLAELIAA